MKTNLGLPSQMLIKRAYEQNFYNSQDPFTGGLSYSGMPYSQNGYMPAGYRQLGATGIPGGPAASMAANAPTAEQVNGEEGTPGLNAGWGSILLNGGLNLGALAALIGSGGTAALPLATAGATAGMDLVGGLTNNVSNADISKFYHSNFGQDPKKHSYLGNIGRRLKGLAWNVANPTLSARMLAHDANIDLGNSRPVRAFKDMQYVADQYLNVPEDMMFKRPPKHMPAWMPNAAGTRQPTVIKNGPAPAANNAATPAAAPAPVKLVTPAAPIKPVAPAAPPNTIKPVAPVTTPTNIKPPPNGAANILP